MKYPPCTDPLDWLRERVHLEHRGSAEGGRFVLYWMATCLRANDNPCLDAALRDAHARSLPLLVYQGLTWRAWYASDRTHSFLLQGSIDVARALRARGIRYALHVERDARTRGALLALARSAAAIFTEDFPVGPFPRWRAALATASRRPLYVVDTACVLPMRVVGRAWERAYAFREATHASRLARVRAPRLDVPTVAAWQEALPFEETHTEALTIADVLATMHIDHSVAPVPGLNGGADAATAHWNTWRAAHLGTYHQRRSDASDATGASYLSPWLHFGMIAPWRVASDALDAGGDGAAKYLDELLTWRELAWCFCAHRPDHDALSALPAWALQSLAATRARRMKRPSLDAIERGETGDAMFDLAQQSLVRRGVLHNNARMTWGRTLAAWFDEPSSGLQVITDLNHRYALDGRDPASYGGILWCYGQFDRAQGDHGGPLGAITARVGDTHLRRIDVPRYRAWIDAPRRPQCVIVGAGIAGLMAAYALRMQGTPVTLIDKGRAPGGRLATRRIDGATYDHGAQFITFRDERMHRFADAWRQAGIIVPWFEETWRGAQGMSSVSKYLARGADVVCATRVERITRVEGGWLISAEGGASWCAEAVVLTAPVPQSLTLLDVGSITLPTALRATLESITYDRVLAALFEGRWSSPFSEHGVGNVEGTPFSWLASNRAKGISARDSLTAHATSAWSLEHWQEPDDVLLHVLGEALTAIMGREAGVTPVALKRWRYARPVSPLPRPCVHREGDATLIFAGDAFDEQGGRIEGAALSGLAAAGLVLSAHMSACSKHDSDC